MSDAKNLWRIFLSDLPAPIECPYDAFSAAVGALHAENDREWRMRYIRRLESLRNGQNDTYINELVDMEKGWL